MKKFLKLFNDEIPVDTQKFLDGKLLLQANTGGGKSWATRRIIEQFAGIVPQIILDPEGEFFTLRQKFPDFVLIGKGQPIVADPQSAGLLAHRIIEERISVIIDLLEMTSRDRDLFVKNFIQAMISAPRELWLPTLLTIDEAQIFAPEKGESEVTGVLKDAGFRFRKRHFGMILATPRIAEFSKSVASTCKNKLIGQATLDNDMKRAASEIGFTTKEDVNALRDLDPGEFFAYGPAFSKKVIKIKIGKTLTQHGDSANINARVAKPSPKVQKALEILAAVPQAAAEEAKTIQSLTKELNSARGQIRAFESGLKPSNPPLDAQALTNAITQAVTRATAVRDREWQQIVDGANKGIKKLQNALKEIGASTEIYKTVPIFGMPINEKAPVPVIESVPIPQGMPRRVVATESSVVGDLKPATFSVLKVVAGDPDGLSIEDIAILTGYKGTARYEHLRALTERGYIERRGNTYFATPEGISILGNEYQPRATGQALQDEVLARITGDEKRTLEFLITQNPIGASKQQISEYLNKKGTATYEVLRKLSAQKLIFVEKGVARASDKLFG